MSGQEYWESVALLREQYAQECADAVIRQIGRLYEEAAEEIDKQIRKILKAFSETANLDAETAEEYISKAEQDVHVRELRRLYAAADSPEEKAKLLTRINARAYGARITRLQSVQEKAYIVLKRLALEEEERLGELLQTVYKDTYYQTIHDIGLGTNIGIDFAVFSERQVKTAVERPWMGTTFSERVWTNTDKLAQQAGAVISRGIADGHSVHRMADQLKTLSKRGQYAAVRLVRTETNYICNQAQLDAYAGAGIERYKFIATLDYRTCEVCQPLDGMEFYCAEARPGLNYPTMHPNCRCTTTIPTAYLSRWANDGEHKYKTGGDVAYGEWANQMTPEQKTAFEGHVKQWRNKASDQKQYARYAERLGKENMPKTFDLFQDLKYNDVERWSETKGFYRYKGENPKAVLNDYRCFKELEKLFPQGSFHIPPKEINSNLLAFDDVHINKERLHSVSAQKAVNYIKKAKASRTVWNGKYERYYSSDGVVYVNLEEKIIRTTFSKREFDEITIQILEVLEKYGV